MFQCIGHTRDRKGNLARCTVESDIPTGPSGRWTVFLCSDCANALPNNRPQYQPEVLEVDKPNYDEDDPEFFHARISQDEMDLEDFRNLDELDLD